MSEVKAIYTIDNIKLEFDNLIKNLAEILKEIRPRTNILNTKLGTIKRHLENIEGVDSDSLAKIIEIATKYNAINNIFLHNIDYNKKI